MATDSKITTVVFPQSEWLQAKKKALELGLTMRELIRRAVKAYDGKKAGKA